MVNWWKKYGDYNVEASLRKVAIENGYELLGLAFINLLLTTYEDGLERVFLEMYVPIKECRPVFTQPITNPLGLSLRYS